eukprot:jgi/Mesen1/9091/ME000058S08582
MSICTTLLLIFAFRLVAFSVQVSNTLFMQQTYKLQCYKSF